MKQLTTLPCHQKAIHSHSAKSPKYGDTSRWLTVTKRLVIGSQAMRALNRLFFFAGLIGCCGGASADDLITFSVVIKDGHITPALLEVPVGKKIKLAIKNEGPGPCEFESLDLKIEKVLASGSNSFVVIHPLKQGNYRFFDEFHPSSSEMLLIAK